MLIKEQKSNLRKQIIQARDNLDLDLRQRRSQAICEHLLRHPAYVAADTVMAFWPFGSEVDILPVLRSTLEQNKRLCLPKIVADTKGKSMQIKQVKDLQIDVAPGFKNIAEPIAICGKVLPPELDLVIVPAVACDQQGGRLGYGGGYYDRLLVQLKQECFRLCVIFAEQVVESLPSDDFDEQIDEVLC